MNDADTRQEGMAAPLAASTSLLCDTEFLTTLRHQMHRFATLQLSDTHLADDAVQEALVGALKNAGSFGGRASSGVGQS